MRPETDAAQFRYTAPEVDPYTIGDEGGVTEDGVSVDGKRRFKELKELEKDEAKRSSLTEEEPVWTLNLRRRYRTFMPLYGWVQSPLVVGDLVYAAPLSEKVGLVALNRFTGEFDNSPLKVALYL